MGAGMVNASRTGPVAEAVAYRFPAVASTRLKMTLREGSLRRAGGFFRRTGQDLKQVDTAASMRARCRITKSTASISFCHFRFHKRRVAIRRAARLAAYRR